jgi:NTP pyrophosphatase (non-canonical NTP hydrolase)
VTLEELTDLLREFAEARDWGRFHTPKNLSMALAGEAGELLAELQWVTAQESANLPAQRLAAVSEEMADVLIYLCRLADVLGVDLLAAAASKVEANAARYPVDTVRGSADKRP